MRGIRIAAAIACLGAGCTFTRAEAPDAGPAADGAGDALPPACTTDAAYAPSPVGRRYRIGPADVDYDTAIDQCAADGAHLAVVDDAVENAYLASVLLPLMKEGWIGFDDLTVEGALNFKWVTGAPVTFTGWSAGEPNNTNNEDCAAVKTNGQWHDVHCEEGKRPICECDPAYRPPPTPRCRMEASGFILKRGRRVFAGTSSVTWQKADEACKAMGAHLLVIGDVDENVDMMAGLTGSYWLGYTDAALEGSFRWVNGAPSPYTNWNNPPQADTSKNCAVLEDDGRWDNVECDETSLAACECDPAPP